MNTPLFSHKVAEIFVKVDDFCNEFEHEFKKQSLPAPAGVKKRNRKPTLTDSEIITILIAFHGGQFRNFKHFYCHYVCHHLRDCFPDVVSYNRFIELSHRCFAAVGIIASFAASMTRRRRVFNPRRTVRKSME